MAKKKKSSKKRKNNNRRRVSSVSRTPKRTNYSSYNEKKSYKKKVKVVKLRKPIIFIILLGIIVLLFLIFNSKKDNSSDIKKDLSIVLNGKDNIVLEYGNLYEDEGATAKYKDTDLSKDIKTDTNINFKKVGDYYYKYKITYEKVSKEVKRTISIKDTSKPIITLNGNSTISIYIGDTYKELGATAKDNYDGDISKSISVSGSVNTKKAGTYTVTYKTKDSSGNENSINRTVKVIKKTTSNTDNSNGVIGKTSKGYTIEKKDGLYYINGILVVNKTYNLPSTYNPGGLLAVFNTNFNKMKEDAKKEGLTLSVISGFRSYSYQNTIYNKYVKADGQAEADRYSARPGHSEHQTGLAADINKIDYNWGKTPEGKWLNDNCYKYGFILRYLEGKESITGYKYEPWHIRYVGVDLATKLYNDGDWITLEEYLGITSKYS